MARMSIAQALDVIGRSRTDEIVIATMSAAQLWPRYTRSERDFTHAAPMGGAPSIGLGIALARPDVRVLVLDGDGSLRMNLGVLLTVGQEAPANFVHAVIENGVYNLTGKQPVPGQQRTAALPDMARAAGYRNVHVFEDVESLDLALLDILRAPGPTFVSIHVTDEYDPADAGVISRSPAGQTRRARTGWTRLRNLLRTSSPA